MPKTLLIIRHGKSSWDQENTSDVDRLLKETGIVRTQMIAQKLLELNIFPGLILTSHAKRALHTAQIIAKQLGYPEENIRIDRSIYDSDAHEVLKIIKKSDPTVDTLFIFGHNPTFTYLANMFLQHTIIDLPTSGTVILSFSCEKWKSISSGNKSYELTLFPKTLNKLSEG
jgi:phosphohistidine phosphatase